MARQDKDKERRSKSLVPWRPFTDLTRWERDMDRLFEDFLDRRWRPLRSGHWWPAKAIDLAAPVVDLFEEKDEIVAKIELPGVGKDDIEVNVRENSLTIKGEKKRKEEVKEENYYRSERSYGAFVRTVELPQEIQVDKARASFKEGLLEVRMPKSEAAKRKEIKIKVD